MKAETVCGDTFFDDKRFQIFVTLHSILDDTVNLSVTPTISLHSESLSGFPLPCGLKGKPTPAHTVIK